jgi:hypothetical protein
MALLLSPCGIRPWRTLVNESDNWPIHPSAWKKRSANFVYRGFSEIGYRSYLVLFRWLRRQSNNKSASIAVNAVKVPRLLPEGGVRPSTKPLGFVYSENSGS